jgi:hypothetical protein
MSRETESQADQVEYFEERKFNWERNKIGLELRHRYELYFVTLTFTLLGLAIQSAKHSESQFTKYFEFTGWFLLLSSGLLGLRMVHELWLREVGVAEISNLRLHGRKYESLLKDVTALELRLRTINWIRATLFVFALIALMISRGFEIL